MRVALVLVERRRLGQVVLLAVDADADEALLAGALEDPVALGLAVLDQRAEDEQPGALGQRQDLVDDLAGRSGARSRGRIRAVRVADAREQQPQVVVDLGDRADGRPRVAEAPFWSIEIAGDRPSIWSTSGFSIWPRNWRAYAHRLST